jgi:hypothetical protein
MTLATASIANPVKVMRLGAIHSGTNLSKYSANGDQRYSYVMLSVPPVYLKLRK